MEANPMYLQDLGARMTRSAGVSEFVPNSLLWAVASLASCQVPEACVMAVDTNAIPIRWTSTALMPNRLIQAEVATDHWERDEGTLVSARAIPLRAVAAVDAIQVEGRGVGSIPWGVSWTITLTSAESITLQGLGRQSREAIEDLGVKLLARI